MIKILNENFAKQVKKELRKKTRFSRDAYVFYTINNENRTGTLTIKLYDGDVSTEIGTPIEFRSRKVSLSIQDGKQIKRIVFNVEPVDTIFDIILQDHFIEPWRNAYGWDMQIIEKGVTKDTLYHISHIRFYNEKRNKTTTIKSICFNGCEMIQTD